MSILDRLRGEAASFEEEIREKYEKSVNLLEQFKKRFPFHEDKTLIDKLSPEEVYNPGSGDYFFYWVEHKLKSLGHIAVGSTRKTP